MSNSVRPHRRQPTRLPHPWDSPDKNTGVGCHFLLQCMKVKSESEVPQSCPTLHDPMDCSPPGSSVHGIFRQESWSGVPLLLLPANESRIPQPATWHHLFSFCLPHHLLFHSVNSSGYTHPSFSKFWIYRPHFFLLLHFFSVVFPSSWCTVIYGKNMNFRWTRIGFKSWIYHLIDA